MSYTPVRGGNLYYETAGEGTPLVFVHARFLDSRMWDDQFQLSAKGNRVIRYDVRGFGRSSRPSEEYSDTKTCSLCSSTSTLRAPIFLASPTVVESHSTSPLSTPR